MLVTLELVLRKNSVRLVIIRMVMIIIRMVMMVIKLTITFIAFISSQLSQWCSLSLSSSLERSIDSLFQVERSIRELEGGLMTIVLMMMMTIYGDNDFDDDDNNIW